MTKPQLTSLGREFPFSLHNIPNLPSDLLVAYRNGLEHWNLSGQPGTRSRSYWGRIDALAVLNEGPNAGLILVAGEVLGLLGADFQSLSTARLPGSEAIRTLLPIGPEMILAMDDEEQVTPLIVSDDRTLSVGQSWL